MGKVNQIWRTAAWLLLVALLLSACSGGGPASEEPTEAAGPTEENAAPSPEPTAEPSATSLPELPESTLAEQTYAALLAAEHPVLDKVRLASEFFGVSQDDLTPQLPESYSAINDRTNFYYNSDLAGNYELIPARLRNLSENSAWWASVNSRIDDQSIQAAADQFEELVRPINLLIFGKESSPGIDDDPRVQFLLVQEPNWGGVFGYFSSRDQFPTAVEPFSNQREMLTINTENIGLDSLTFAGSLAHEYQHLIHWNKDPNEDQWLNEAMAELANFLTGAPEASSAIGLTNAELFAENPDIQLTARPERGSLTTRAHYAAERLLMVYLLEQFGDSGPQLLKDIVANPNPGVLSIQQELDKLPGAPRFNDIYANWLVANLLDQTDLQDGQFGYVEANPVRPLRREITGTQREPVQDKLLPYGARYYDLRSDKPMQVTFNGPAYAQLTPIDPASGQFAWYSNRGDYSDFQLSRSFDLTKVDSATLNYKVWYELDELFDYGYVEVSTDGGQTWEILQTAYGTDKNPNGQSLGFGYSGTALGWQQESLDLTPYTGKEIQLRFAVRSDFTANRDGLQLDDIEIPEIGFFDGAEDDSGGWEERGFIRSANRVPLEWILWLVKPGRPTQVERLSVKPGEPLTFEVTELGERINFATLIVSPTAPVTTIGQEYELIFSTP